MEVSFQHPVPAALLHEKKIRCPLNRTLGGRQSRYGRLGKRKFSCPCQNSNPGPSSPQPRRYTDCNRRLWSDSVQTWQALARVLSHGRSSFPCQYDELHRKGTQAADMSNISVSKGRVQRWLQSPVPLDGQQEGLKLVQRPCQLH